MPNLQLNSLKKEEFSTFDIITFGSASWDVFLELKEAIKNKQVFFDGKKIYFPMGSKVNIKGIHFFSGGGGTNTAVGFAKQGFRVAYCGLIGDDLFGIEILKELKEKGVDCRFVLKTNLKPTNCSVVLTCQNIDRTILSYRGASEELINEKIPYEKLSAKWFYLAPLSGKSATLTTNLIKFAKERKIKVAFNPGNSQILLPKKIIKDIIKKVDILILNQEEASLLTGIYPTKEKEIFKEIDNMCPGIVIITKGAKGVIVSNGKEIYQAKVLKIKVIDKTGAGDSFGSGFVSGFIKSQGKIDYSIQLGIANSSACIGKWGAKNGLLKEGDNWKKVEIKKTILK